VATVPDLTGQQGRGRSGSPAEGQSQHAGNAAGGFLVVRALPAQERHGRRTDWYRPQQNGDGQVNFEWAGAGNNDPFNDFDLDGYPDYRAQLSMGWIKRVLDAVNPYEARIRDFEGDSPSTVSSMLQQLGPRFEGPVALNPDKNVIENVGLIELYETILKRGSDLSINLSSPVSTPAIANALQLASTRSPTSTRCWATKPTPTPRTRPSASAAIRWIRRLAPAVFSFQNQLSSLLEEELALLRGVDDYLARPVYNRSSGISPRGRARPPMR
jgi:hypothetical protein